MQAYHSSTFPGILRHATTWISCTSGRCVHAEPRDRRDETAAAQIQQARARTEHEPTTALCRSLYQRSPTAASGTDGPQARKRSTEQEKGEHEYTEKG